MQRDPNTIVPFFLDLPAPLHRAMVMHAYETFAATGKRLALRHIVIEALEHFLASSSDQENSDAR